MGGDAWLPLFERWCLALAFPLEGRVGGALGMDSSLARLLELPLPLGSPENFKQDFNLSCSVLVLRLWVTPGESGEKRVGLGMDCTLARLVELPNGSADRHAMIQLPRLCLCSVCSAQ